MENQKKNFIWAGILLTTIIALFVLNLWGQAKFKPQTDLKNIQKTEATTENKSNDNQLSLDDFEGLSFMDGKAFNKEDYKDKLLIVNFWASWCHNCRHEMPDLQKFYDKTKDGDKVAFITVNLTDGVGETEEKAKAYLSENKFTLPTILDKEQQLFGKLGLSAVPVTAIINKDGKALPLMAFNNKVYYFHIGAITEEMLDQYVELILEEGTNS